MPPARSKRRRRVLALLAATAGTLALLHVPAVRLRLGRAVAGAVGSRAGADIRLDGFDFSLWRMSASADGVSVRMPGMHARIVRVQVSLTSSRRWIVHLVQPEVVLEPTPGAPTPDTPWTALDALERLGVVGGTVRTSTGAGADALDVSVVRDGAALVLAGHAAVRTSPAAAPLDLRLDASVRPGKVLEIDHLDVTAGPSYAGVSGKVRGLAPVRATLDGTAHVELAQAAAFGLASPLSGTVTGSLAVRDETVRIDGSLAGVHAAGVGPLDGRAVVLVDRARATVESVDLAGYGGRVRVQGAIPFDGSPAVLRVQPEGLEAADLARDAAGTAVGLASRASGDLEVRLAAGAPPSVQGRLQLVPSASPRGLPLSARVALSMASGAWRADLTGVQWPGGRAVAHVRASAAGALEGDAVVEGDDLSLVGETMRRVLGEPPPAVIRTLHGRAQVAMALGGTIARPTIRGSVVDSAVDVAGIAFSGAGGFQATRDALVLDGLEARLASGGRATVSGTVALAETGQWDVTARLERVVLVRPGGDASRAPVLDGEARVEGPARALRWTASAVATAAGSAPGSVHARAAGQGAQIADAEITIDGVTAATLRPLVTLPADVEGTLAGTLHARGPARAPRGEGQLTLTTVRWRGAALPDASLEIDSDGATAQATAHWPGEVAHATVALTPDHPLVLEADLGALPTTEVMQAFPAFAKDGHVDVRGQLRVAGALADPGSLHATGEVQALDVKWRDQGRHAGPFRVTADRAALEVAGLAFDDGTAVDARIPYAADGPLAAHVRGTPDLRMLQAITGVALDGDAELDLRVAGTRLHPRVEGDAALQLRAGRAGTVAWDEATVRLAADGEQVRVEELRVKLQGGEVSASGALPLWAVAGGPVRALDVSVAGVDLLARVGAPASGPAARAVVEAHARLEASSWDPARARVAGEAAMVLSRGGDTLLQTTTPARFRVEGGVATLEPSALEGPAGHLKMHATTPLPGAPAAVVVAEIAGAVDLAVLNPLLASAGVAAFGNADVDLRWHRDAGAAAASGEGGITLRGARVNLEDPPTSISDLDATLRLRGQAIALESLSARIGGGRLTASGEVDTRTQRVALKAEADRVSLTALEGVTTRISGPLSVTGEAGAYKLEGDLKIPGGLITREFDAVTESLTTLDWQLRSLRGAGPADRLALAVRLRTTEDLRVRNHIADLRAGGTLNVRGTLGSYLVDGAIDVRPGGTVFIGTTRTQTAAGRVELSGYPLRAPQLDLNLRARASSVNIELAVSGTTDNIKTELRAPDRTDLTESDLTSLLLTGRRLEQATQEGGDVAKAQLAAALGNRLEGRLGDRFEVEVESGQNAFSHDSDPNTRMRASRLISDQLKVSYSVGLDGEDQQWQVDWRPIRRVRLLGIAHENDVVSLSVDNSFTLNLPGRTSPTRTSRTRKVGVVELAGDQPRPLEEMQRRIRVRSGRRFDPWAARADADRLRAWLSSEGWRGALVDVEETPAPDGKQVDVRFLVRAGPVVRFEWTGDDPGADIRKRVEAAWDAYRAPELLPTELARRATWALRGKGFVEAQVEATTRVEGDVRIATFHVVPGPPGGTVVVEFPGRATVPEDELRARLPKVGSAAFFEMLDEPAQLELTLRLPYAQRGMLEVAIGAVERRPGTPLRILIPITEPAPEVLVEVRVPELPAGGAPLALKLSAGEPFRLSDFEADRAALARHYQEHGYLDARLRARIEPATAGIRLVYEVEPGPQFHVGAVHVTTHGRIREDIVRRLIPFKEGDVLRPSALTLARRRVGQLPVVRSVDVDAEPSPLGEDVRDVVVEIAERPDLEVRYGVRWNSGDPDANPGTDAVHDQSVEYGGTVVVSNPFGRGLRLGAFAAIRTDAYDVGGQAAAFNLFGWRRLTTELFLRDRSEDEEDTDGTEVPTDTRSFTLQLSRAIRRQKLRVQTSYAHSVETRARTAGDYVLHRGSLNLGLVADRRDSFIDPRKGHFASVNGAYFDEVLGSDLQFTRFFAQGYFYVPFGPVVWASAVRLGAIPGQRQEFDDDDLFQTGGPSTVRGFELDALAPVDARGVKGGQALAVVNQELRLKVFGPVQLGAFFDAGNAFATVSDVSLGGMREDAGLGARLVMPFGVFRVDWAHVLDPQPGESKARWVLSFGQAF